MSTEASKPESSKGGEKQKAKARAFTMTNDQADKDPDVVTGTFLINDIPASVLFDSGATTKSAISIHIFPSTAITSTQEIGYVGGQQHQGGYGASPEEVRAKVKQCDENCDESCGNARICISCLRLDVTVDELRELFGGNGQVGRIKQKLGYKEQWPCKIKVYTDEIGNNKGVAALVYEGPSAAHSAHEFYNNYEMRCRKFSIGMAEKPAPRALPPAYGHGSSTFWTVSLCKEKMVVELSTSSSSSFKCVFGFSPSILSFNVFKNGFQWRFCRLGGFAYRDGAFKSSPRTAEDFGSQHSAMFVAYRGWAAYWAIAYRGGLPESPISLFQGV
ncbi:hypothetical protein E3N88_17376 [Mikania micrantha]|uniref:RRM domain-containing protein n=1 Tax=Mikania micrantha TaxID=192012 RepID=A0A5N6NT60_9ASTR|nr:hypothetical protein E3N88_17376 [Mikania micrantha]